MKTGSLYLMILFAILFAVLPSCSKRKVELGGICRQVYDKYNVGDRFYLLKNKQDTIEFIVQKKEIKYIEGHVFGHEPAAEGYIYITNDMGIKVHDAYSDNADRIIINYNSSWYELWRMYKDSFLLDSFIVNHVTYKGNICKLLDWRDTLYFSINDGILYIHDQDDIYERIK